MHEVNKSEVLGQMLAGLESTGHFWSPLKFVSPVQLLGLVMKPKKINLLIFDDYYFNFLKQSEKKSVKCYKQIRRWVNISE